MRSILLAAGFLLLIAATPSVADKAPAEPDGGPLDLADVLALTLSRNPGLAAAAETPRIREAEARQAALRPRPELGLDVEGFGGSGDLGGFDGAEFTLSVSQVLELGGKRGRRLDLARSGIDASVQDSRLVRRVILAAAAGDFAAVLAAQERVALADEGVAVATEDLEAAAHRRAAGAASLLDESRARTALAEARLQAAAERRSLAASRKRLALYWGDDAPRFGEVRGDLAAMAPPPAAEALADPAASGPVAGLWEAEARALRAELALARAQGAPDLDLGLGVRRMQETGDGALVLGLSLPLPFGSWNRGGILAAESRIAQADHRRESDALALRAQQLTIHETMTAAFAEAQTLEGEILPESALTTAAARDAYAKGQLGLTDILDVRRTDLELRLRLIDARLRYHQARFDLERLAGDDYVPTLSPLE